MSFHIKFQNPKSRGRHIGITDDTELKITRVVTSNNVICIPSSIEICQQIRKLLGVDSNEHTHDSVSPPLVTKDTNKT